MVDLDSDPNYRLKLYQKYQNINDLFKKEEKYDKILDSKRSQHQTQAQKTKQGWDKLKNENSKLRKLVRSNVNVHESENRKISHRVADFEIKSQRAGSANPGPRFESNNLQSYAQKLASEVSESQPKTEGQQMQILPEPIEDRLLSAKEKL